ncbi:MAG: ATP-binding protein [Clostridia bacterium]|nr:ATP-binding protein [Clostridia bacterium]
MNGVQPDIPRLYTALAEWCACLVYLLAARRGLRGGKLALAAAAALPVQAAFLVLTGGLPILFWIPCMALAVALMFFFLLLAGGMTPLDAGYSCMRAFVLAEFAASLEWQIYCFFWPRDNAPVWVKALMLVTVYGAVFFFMGWLEQRHRPRDGRLGLTARELWSAVVIGVAVFAVSNLSFVSVQTPFSGQYGAEIYSIRTIVDLGGLAILYAHYVQCCSLRVRRELEAVENILQNQYQQYQQSKESIDLVNRKYHDLKHQIAVLRAEPDAEKRGAFLDEMERDIRDYEAQNKTGNSVLDTVLTSKSLYCARHGISLTCVADGKLLDFMDVMDICTIFGNALDNAIECEERIAEASKRLIHVSVSAQKGFVLLRFENYFEGELAFEERLPVTTKGDKTYHGYGLKSLRYVAQKYGGTMTAGTEKGWFELKVLLPLDKR